MTYLISVFSVYTKLETLSISQSRDTETGVLDFLAAYVKSKNMSADFPQRIREILEHY